MSSFKPSKNHFQRHNNIVEDECAMEEKKQDDAHPYFPGQNNVPSRKNANAAQAMESLNDSETATASVLIKKGEHTPAVKCSRKIRRGWLATFAGSFLRIFLLDLPLLAVFALYISILALERFGHDYLVPQIRLMEWTPDRAAHELTYYHRKCTAEDQTAHDTAELIATPDMSVKERVDLMVKHGATVYPNLLSTETATELRDFILEQNQKKEDMIWVINNDNRWSFYLRVDQHPSVAKALKEILNKPFLADALEEITGPNPAVIEFTTITSAYGAAGQHWHQDVVPEGNGAKYARNFVPSYSLFIPLQNVTAGMGATGICPGTAMCAEGCDEFCPQTGFLMSGRQDNWPTGWGALVNQQTTHRGSPFTDPNAPHRVLFILTFAPRPRFGERQLETRYIGTGGSYSLHYSQWGATLRDFQDPEKYMRQPWRTLRSFGLYKPANTDWGWDFFTQASGRIANGDVGYAEHDFDEFIENGGIPFLPKSLQGDARGSRLYGNPWIDFAFDTVSRCRSAVERGYVGAVAVYFLVSIVFSFLIKRQNKASFIMSSMIHVVLIHSVVMFVAWWRLSAAQNRSWAKNVLTKRLFSLPKPPFVSHPDLPASLPRPQDILILNEMKSDYFASFSRVLDAVHPGNKAWSDMINQNAQGYHRLPIQLQKQLRSSLLQTVREEHRHIMVKNIEGNWAEVDEMTADWLCHKELFSSSSSLVGEVTRQIDYLLSETRFGFWRDTTLHLEYIPTMLEKLQDSILHLSREQRLVRHHGRPKSGTPRVAAVAVTPAGTRNTSMSRLNLPPRPKSEAPIDEVWLKEFDTIEATYDGEFMGG